MFNWKIHDQFDSDARRNGKFRLIRSYLDDGESHVVASNIRPEHAGLLAAMPDLLAASEAFLAELDSGNDFNAWEKAKADLRAAVAKAKEDQ